MFQKVGGKPIQPTFSMVDFEFVKLYFRCKAIPLYVISHGVNLNSVLSKDRSCFLSFVHCVTAKVSIKKQSNVFNFDGTILFKVVDDFLYLLAADCPFGKLMTLSKGSRTLQPFYW